MSKIYKVISKCMKEIGAIGKDQTNKAQGFKFRGIDQVYNALNQHLVNNEIFTVPEVLDMRSERLTTTKGTAMHYVMLKMKYTMYADDGSSISSIVYGEAMDSGDKATNKAMSIAHKYFFLQLFCIPTQEQKDPDYETHEIAFRPVGQPERNAKDNRSVLPEIDDNAIIEKAAKDEEKMNARKNFHIRVAEHITKEPKEMRAFLKKELGYDASMIYEVSEYQAFEKKFMDGLVGYQEQGKLL